MVALTGFRCTSFPFYCFPPRLLHQRLCFAFLSHTFFNLLSLRNVVKSTRGSRVLASQWLRDCVWCCKWKRLCSFRGSGLNREGKNLSKHRRRHFSFNHSWAEIHFVITGERRSRGLTLFSLSFVKEQYWLVHARESLTRLTLPGVWRTVKC